jgi:cell division inhibitor SepF
MNQEGLGMNNFKDKLNDFFFLTEEEIEDQDAEEVNEASTNTHDNPAPAQQEKTPRVENYMQKKSGGENVVAINQKQSLQKPQITIVELRLYSEVQEVADYLLSSQSVILNFRRMDNEQAAKMIDFLMGVTYAVKGDIQRLDEELFICTPQSVTVNGSDLSEYTDSLL